MSGIYIKGMEMPKEGCHHIICIYADGTVATGGKTYRAVPVPDHGRLVDADALMADIGRSIVFSGRIYNPVVVGASKVVERVEDAPTIIPASIGDENG